MPQIAVPSLNIGIGEYCSSLIKEFQEHVLKYDTMLSNVTTNCWIMTEGNTLLIEELSEQNKFNLNIALGQADFPESSDFNVFEEAIKRLFYLPLRLANSVAPNGINIEGGRIFIHVFVPLFEPNAVECLSWLLTALKKGTECGGYTGFSFKVFGLTHKVAIKGETQEALQKLVIGSKQTRENIYSIKKLAEEYPEIFHNYFIIDNINRDNLAVELDFQGLCIVFNEVILASMLNPYVFGHTELQNQISSLGLGMVKLDPFLVKDYFSLKILESGFRKDGIIIEKEIPADEVIYNTNKVVREGQKLFGEFMSETNQKLLTKDFYSYFEDAFDPIRGEKDHVSFFRQLIREYHEQITEKALSESDHVAMEQIERLEKVIGGFLESKYDNLTSYKGHLGNFVNETDYAVQENDNLVDRISMDDIEYKAVEYFLNFLPEKERVSRTSMRALQKRIRETETYITSLNKDLHEIGLINPQIKRNESIEFIKGVLKVDGKDFNISGFSPSVVSEDSVFFTPDSATQVPMKVDLRRFFGKVEDQASVPGCSTHAIGAMYDYFMKRHKQKTTISKPFLYSEALSHRDPVTDSEGLGIVEVMAQLTEHGACQSDYYTNDDFIGKTPPSKQAYNDARNHKIKLSSRIKSEENDFFGALAQGLPIVIGLKIYASFFNSIDDGIVAVPSEDERNTQDFGFHAMLIVGYSKKEKYFLVRNSWGENFGEKGYCYIPFHYIFDNASCVDSHVVNEVTSQKSEFSGELHKDPYFFMQESIIIKL